MWFFHSQPQPSQEPSQEVQELKIQLKTIEGKLNLILNILREKGYGEMPQLHRLDYPLPIPERTHVNPIENIAPSELIDDIRRKVGERRIAMGDSSLYSTTTFKP